MSYVSPEVSVTTITPRDPFGTNDDALTALCLWREARSEGAAGMLGVLWVLKNRQAMAPAQGFKATMRANILKPYAFSCFNSNDPQCELYPQPGDVHYQLALEALKSVQPDPTGGAVFYFSRPLTEAPKVWGDVHISAIIGNLTFCAMGAAPVVIT